jgi:PilZ domain
MQSPSAGHRFARYQIQLPVLQKTAPTANRVEVGWTRDLSEGGACLELPTRLPTPAVIWLRLQADRGPIEMQARVVWSGEPSAPGRGVVHGVAFVGISEEQRLALHAMLSARRQASESGVRLLLDLPVTCRLEHEPGSPLRGRTVDLSREGVLLLLDRPLPSGTSVEVLLHTPQGSLTAEGVVVWADLPGEGRTRAPVQHGLRLTSLSWSTPLVLGLVLADPPH